MKDMMWLPIGILIGMISMAVLYWQWHFRAPRNAMSYTRGDAKKDVEIALANWDIVVMLRAQLEVMDTRKEFEGFLKDVANKLLEVYDAGVATGMEGQGHVVRLYRKQVESAEAVADAKVKAWEKRREEWARERDLFVKLWRATKRLMTVTSVAGGPEREVLELLQQLNRVPE